MTRPGMELTCEELVELITDYLEGIMPPEERLRFEDHLDICEGCRAYLDHMRATLRMIGHLREENIPAHTSEQLLVAFRTWRQEM